MGYQPDKSKTQEDILINLQKIRDIKQPPPKPEPPECITIVEHEDPFTMFWNWLKPLCSSCERRTYKWRITLSYRGDYYQKYDICSVCSEKYRIYTIDEAKHFIRTKIAIKKAVRKEFYG